MVHFEVFNGWKEISSQAIRVEAGKENCIVLVAFNGYCALNGTLVAFWLKMLN